MSVLVPCQKPLVHRACMEQEQYNLLDWFSHAELLAWENVNAYNEPSERPSKIFLVIGQTLTSSYAIAHKEHNSTECEVLLSSKIAIPNLIDAKGLAQYNVEKAHATLGFEEIKTEESEKKYSIFLDVRYSFPIHRFQVLSAGLKARLEDMYRYHSLSSDIINTRLFRKSRQKSKEQLESARYIEFPTNTTELKTSSVSNLGGCN